MFSSKPTSGRKKENVIWEYFSYDGAQDKSTCQVVVDSTSNKICGRKLAGANTTNLKTHLKTFHRDEFKIMDEKQQTRKLPSAAAPSLTQLTASTSNEKFVQSWQNHCASS